MPLTNDIIIQEIFEDKKRFLPLLLLGDEDENMIDHYLQSGRMFVAFGDDNAMACCVVTQEAENLIEIKNLAVAQQFQRQGLGRKMIKFIESIYIDKEIQIGTGETPSTLRFYHQCGYTYSHRVCNFFTDNYSHPIVEEGILLRDMIYLRKTNLLSTSENHLKESGE